MYGFVALGAAILPTGGMADVPTAILRFSVEEEEMLTEVGFDGVLNNVNVAAQSADFNLMVDGVSATTLPVAGQSFTASSKEKVKMAVTLRLSKGAHVVKLQANASVVTDVTIAGATYDCRLFAMRTTADAALAHGVDSKVQSIF